MRAKPDMKPWVNTDKSGLSSVGAALSARAFVLDRVVPPLKGLNKCIPLINPGLAPWAMREYRPKGLFYVITTNQSLGCFDAIALPFYATMTIKPYLCLI